MPFLLTDEQWLKLKARLNQSSFRSRFKLSEKDLSYAKKQGLSVLKQHATDFIASRLADAFPKNDGKQTPMRGHPVFVAQHATATCCRLCLSKWHKIPVGRALTETEQSYIAGVIIKWLEEEMK